MHYARIVVHTMHPAMADEAITQVRADQLPLLQRQPGFVAYEIVDAGDSRLISISTWESREYAEASAPITGAWVRENVRAKIAASTQYGGDVAISSR